MIKLNLLPKNLRRRVEAGWWRVAAVAFGVAVVGVLSFFHLTTLNQLRILETQRSELQTEVNLLQDEIRQDRELRVQQAELQRVLAVESQLASRFVAWSEDIATFLNQIPRDNGRLVVSLNRIDTRLSQDPNNALVFGKPVAVEFTLQGQTRNQSSLIRFVNAFEASPRFGINFQRADRDQNTGNYTFTAVVGLVKQGGESDDASAQ